MNLECEQIQGICEFNFLGTTIQDTLNWAPHTDRIANKISRTLGVMNKLKHFLPTYTLRTMYNSLILPHLNFSILSWGLHSGRLPKLQKRAVRIITVNKYNAHTEPILNYLGLLKVNDIFTLQCLKFYFKCTHERVPTTFASFFTRNTARHDHDTRQRHQPEILLVILREPENVLNFIYHYCLEACQLVLLIKSTPIVLMVSQIILNSTCWPAMKIAVKLETATYAPMLKLACLSSALLCIYNIQMYIFISCIVYRLFYFTSRNCISSCLLFIYL